MKMAPPNHGEDDCICIKHGEDVLRGCFAISQANKRKKGNKIIKEVKWQVNQYVNDMDVKYAKPIFKVSNMRSHMFGVLRIQISIRIKNGDCAVDWSKKMTWFQTKDVACDP
jgi:hypothetical protein